MSEKAKRRRLMSGANAVVIGVVAVVVAILVNAIASQLYWRVDLTQNRIYTLSEVSEQAAEELAEPVEVRAFISPNLPPPFHHLDRQVEELLMEYEAASGGALTYEIISPEDEEEIEEMAAGYGIEPVTIGQQTDRALAYRTVFKGVAFVQGDRVETINELRSSGRPELDSYEYEFTRALLNLELAEPRRVGVVTGQGGPADQPGYVESMQPLFEQMYGRLIQVESVDLNDGFEAMSELSALVFINIEGYVGSEALGVIDRFIQSGGNVGWFQSGGVFDSEEYSQLMERLRAGEPGVTAPLRRPLDSDLIDYFEAMGIRFGSDAVIDRDRALSIGPVPTERGMVHVDHPATFPINDLANELPFMRHFSTLILPLPATVTVDHGSVPDGVDAYEVMRTAESSVRLPQPPGRPAYDELILPVAGEEQGSYTVAAALQGELPRFVRTDDPEDDPHAAAEEARILVVGSGDFMGDYTQVGFGGEMAFLGLQFFMNALEWLAQERELAQIRGKAMPPLITDVPADARRSMKIINIAIVPGFFASIGLLMLVRRRRRKESLAEVGEEITQIVDER